MKGRKMPQDKLLRDFAVVYGVLTTLQVIPRLSPKESPKRNVKLFLHKGLDPEVLRHAIFAMTLPRTYGFLRRRLQDSDLPVGLSSLLIYLVKPSYRRTLVVYIALAAATNFKRDSPLRRSLPPTWTLYLFGNAWLLWAFLFHPKVFPRTYGEVIMRHSGYGSYTPIADLTKFVMESKFEVYPPGELSSMDIHNEESKVPVHPDHKRVVCAYIHPEDPSCLSTYLKAWIEQFPRVLQWVAAFGLISPLLHRRPLNYSTAKEWMISSLRGTAFIVGSINTSWAFTCILQRILLPGFLPRLRWLLNGFLGSLWILILPAHRRTDFGLYSFRLALVCAWDLWDNHSPKFMEAFILALSWTSLLHDKRNGKGAKGLTGLIMNYIEKHV